MSIRVSGLARQAALAGVCILTAAALSGCQGAQATPTVRATVAPAAAQTTGAFFGGQLPPELPQDPAAGFGSVGIIQGSTITLTAGRGGFPGGQATDSQTPRARAQDGQPAQGQAGPGQGFPGQGGQGQGGQGQGGQGQRGQFQGGQFQATSGMGNATVAVISADTKYFKSVSAAPSGAPGAQGANPPAARPRGTPQPGGGQQDGSPEGTGPQGAPPPGGAPVDGGPEGGRQFALTAEPGTAADLQVGSMVMVWGSVIDGRVYADVIYIMSQGPRG